MAKAITLKDIALRCGVSISTVSSALRDEPVVKPLTKARVQAIAQELGYDPAAQEAARRLRLRAVGDFSAESSKVVALLFLSDLFSIPHFSRMAEGAMGVLNRSGYGVFLNGQKDESNESLVLHPAFNRGEIDGIIAGYSPILKPDMLKKLRSLSNFGDKPLISLMKPAPGCHSVVADTFQGGYSLVKKLIGLGHRKFLFVMCGGDGLSPSVYLGKRWNKPVRDRWNGMTMALVEHGLNVDKHMVCLNVEGPWIDPRGLPESRVLKPTSEWPGNGAETIWETIRANPDITAILAHNDPCAFRIWCSLLERGVDIPGDMTLFGFDDSDPVYGPEGSNVLSTVHLPLSDMGQAAGSLIIKLIEEKDNNNGLINIALPPTLVERHSSGQK